jgi:hypothetical protein
VRNSSGKAVEKRLPIVRIDSMIYWGTWRYLLHFLTIKARAQEAEEDEDEDILEIVDVKDTILEFGPHHGKTFEYVIDHFPQYCLNIKRQVRTGSARNLGTLHYQRVGEFWVLTL